MPNGAGALLVLIVDDFPESVDVLFELLSERGYVVALALDGADGVRVAIDRHPDVIVMDLAMPRLDGLAAARLLKADPATREIPVVMFTDHPGHELDVRAEEAGFCCVHAKDKGASPVVDTIARLAG